MAVVANFAVLIPVIAQTVASQRGVGDGFRNEENLAGKDNHDPQLALYAAIDIVSDLIPASVRSAVSSTFALPSHRANEGSRFTFSARRRRRVRQSPCSNWLARIFLCRSRPSPRFDNAGRECVFIPGQLTHDGTGWNGGGDRAMP